METQAPTRPRIFVMAAFALSCFGLLLYLWTAFGGPTPLGPRGYRLQVSFDEATQLAQQADVRISGVPVGKVVKTEARGGLTRAEIQMEARYAPVRQDARAILRQKTLLGETYVELTPGSPAAPSVPEGGSLPRGQVQPTVELDEVLRALDRRTRDDLRTWVTSWAAALRGRGPDISSFLGNAPGAAADADGLLETLDAQRSAVTRLVHDSGVVFSAIGRNEGAVRGAIQAGDAVFSTTAARNADLTETVRILPTFLRELRPTLAAAERTAAVAAPVVRELRRVAPKIPPTLRDLYALAPDAQALFRDLDRVITVSRTALPALTGIVQAARPLVRVLHPVGRELVPVVQYLALYRSELVTAWADVAAATQATFAAPGGPPIHYLRVLIPVNQEAFVSQARRLPSNRHNSYLAPRGLDRLPTGLHAFDCQNLSNPETVPALGPVPPCVVQTPPLVQGRRTAFPQLRRDAP
jgi:phospholipid/cholesterol/gamma-HCH transport system substrate-binding protein